MKKLILSQPSGEDENDFIFSINDKQAQARLGWDGDDEFSFNGDMYDVIEKKIENGMIIIRALADKKETALIQKYSRISGENHSRHKTALLVQLVNSLYLPSVDAISFIKWQFRSVRILLHPVMIVPGVHDVLTPPPRSY